MQYSNAIRQIDYRCISLYFFPFYRTEERKIWLNQLIQSLNNHTLCKKKKNNWYYLVIIGDTLLINDQITVR